MAAVKGKRECEVCGRANASLGNNRGKLACPSCQSLIASVANRPESVAEAARMCGKDGALLTLLGGSAVAVELESSALKRIAKAVGCDGEDGEVLVKAVAAMAATVPDCANCAEGMSEQVADLQAEVERLKGKLDHAAKYPSDDLLKALGLPGDTTTMDELELATLQTAAGAEEYWRELNKAWQMGLRKNDALRGQHEALEAINDAIGLPGDAEAEQIIESISAMTHATNRFRDMARSADERADVAEAQVAAIRTALKAQDSDESTVEVAARRMAVMAKLDAMYGESEERIGAVARRLEDMKMENRNISDRLAEAEAENMRLSSLLDQQNDTFSIAIDPSREALADFGLAVIRGNVTVSHRG